MTRIQWRMSVFTLLFFMLSACAGTEYKSPLTIEVFPDQLRKQSLTHNQQQLTLLLQKFPERREFLRDFVRAMDAEQAEAEKSLETAAIAWVDVLKLESGGLASHAFRKWVALKKEMNADATADGLARELLALTDEGKSSLWLRRQNLLDPSKLSQRVSDQWGDKASRNELPLRPDLIRDDPFWEKAVAMGCGREWPAAWVIWLNAKSSGEKRYWNGLEAQCRGDQTVAARNLQEAIDLLLEEGKRPALILKANEKLIAAKKALGQRLETARAYRQMVQVFDRNGWGAEQFDLSTFDYWRKKIESWQWVARSEGLNGQYESAKQAAQEALHLSDLAIGESAQWNEKQRQTLIDLKAECFHILASRIAYEQGDLAASLSLSRLGASVPGISEDWKLRFQWLEGFVAYQARDFTLAEQKWQSMLLASKDESQKARLRYWRGRALWGLGEKSAAREEFDTLAQQSPLSFYTIVALPKLDADYQPQRFFGRIKKLEQGLSKKQSYAFEALPKDAEVWRRVLRLESALLTQWKTAQSALATDLFRAVTAKPSLMQESEAAIYITRLLHMAEAHLQAISLTSQMTQQIPAFWELYPEQLLVFFPRPYREVYTTMANLNFIDLEIPLAISRQESSFEKTAVSPAEAVGLMQLMPATAQRQALRFGLELSNPKEALKLPETNIRLGTAYLAELGRRYKGQWFEAFAAYNAGEFAVDAWLQRRAADDPIVWIDAISFSETSSYTKNVWRNEQVYRWLLR